MPSASKRLTEAIDVIGEQPAGLTVTELARELGISTAASSRLLASLLDVGIVMRAEDAQRHVLHPRLWIWGMNAARGLRQLCEVARPLMIDAARELDTQLVFSTLQDADVLVFEVLTRLDGVVIALPHAATMPCHACAPGKVMLAYQDPERVDEVLREPLEPLTDETLTSIEALKADFRGIRERGYAINRGEYVVNASAIAVPIFNSRGQAVAAISAAAGNSDEDFATLDALAPALRSLARSISVALGYAPEARVAVS